MRAIVSIWQQGPRPARRAWLGGLLGALLLAACVPSAPGGPSAPPEPAAARARAAAQAPAVPPASANPPTPTKLKLAEVGFVSDASSYFALERGYFREQGLDVELIRIDPQ